MKVTPIKTDPIVVGKQTLFEVLDKFVTTVEEGSILAVTSKIVSICEGRAVKVGEANKEELLEKESQYFLQASDSKYHVSLTITNNLLIANAGIDESNGGGYFVLWPSDPYGTARQVRKYLTDRFSIKNVGVIITDSKTTPLKWGTSGVGIAYSGFAPLQDYIGEPDIFGRKLMMTKANIMEGLAGAANVVMGEGNEQTPLALISEISFVKFQQRDPTEQEIADLRIKIEDDLYVAMLMGVKWKKGQK